MAVMHVAKNFHEPLDFWKLLPCITDSCPTKLTLYLRGG